MEPFSANVTKSVRASFLCDERCPAQALCELGPAHKGAACFSLAWTGVPSPQPLVHRLGRLFLQFLAEREMEKPKKPLEGHQSMPGKGAAADNGEKGSKSLSKPKKRKKAKKGESGNERGRPDEAAAGPAAEDGRGGARGDGAKKRGAKDGPSSAAKKPKVDRAALHSLQEERKRKRLQQREVRAPPPALWPPS